MSQYHNKRKHSALFYNNSKERLQLLADFFQSGLENEELGIFITPTTTKEVVQDFLTVGFDVQSHIERGGFRIFNMRNTYMPDGHFVSNYIINNLVSYMDDAKALGYHGLRIAGEMNWLLDHPDASDEAIRYEAGINNLPLVYPTSVLCIFPTRNMTTTLAENILVQHPSFVYDGKLHDNPYYERPGASPKTTGTKTENTSSSHATETVVAIQAIKNLLKSLKKEAD